MIDVVYQYIDSPAIWEELRYSLRSIDRHLKTDFRVWIVGDLPDWAANIGHIPHKRKIHEWRTNCLDATSKLEQALLHSQMGETILWMYDDMYLLRDITRDELAVYLAVNHLDDLTNRSSGVHKSLVKTTLEILKEHGKSTWNCETHTPRLYNKNILMEIFYRYNTKESRLLFSTLYFNDLYGAGIDPIIMSKDDMWKAGFYGFSDPYSFKSNDEQEINDILSGKTFLNHNNDGLSVSLKKVIEDRFPDKCKFEA